MPHPTKRHNATIVDATSDTKINVKPVDIKGAVCRDHQRCVVARAILRQKASTAAWVDVGNTVVLIGQSRKKAVRYLLDNISREQVRFFDENDGRFAPCQVHLYAPKKKGPRDKRVLGARKGSKRGGNIKRKVSRKPTR